MVKRLLGLGLVLTLATGCAAEAADDGETSSLGNGDEGDPAPSSNPPAPPAPLDSARRPRPEPLPIPKFARYEALCKLINNQRNDDATPNGNHLRANLMGTDLGIPVAHGDRLFLFFGDTMGYKGIWRVGESLPDAVGYALGTVADVANDPKSLCTQMRFVRLPANSSIGPKVDARIEGDFAPAAMIAPRGLPLGEFIRNPSGNGTFPQLPGDFEVPSGAFSHAGSIYLFYTTVNSSSDVEMKASYLAKWRKPDPAGLPTYEILYPVDQRFDAGGTLGGNFINIAAETFGPWVYLYGTGEYRESPVYLARKLLASLDEPGGFQRYDPKKQIWVPQGTSVDPIVAASYNGEMSVRHYPEIGRYMMLNQQGTPTYNRVIARFAERPQGPWSEAVTVHDMGDRNFTDKHCCSAAACGPQQLFNCSKAGFYGTYLFPFVRGDRNEFTVTYTMSTWDPYNVALMQATFSAR